MIKKRTVSLDTARFLSCFFSCSTTGAKAAFFFTDSRPFLQLAALAHSDDLAIARLQVELDAGGDIADNKLAHNIVPFSAKVSSFTIFSVAWRGLYVK